MHEHTWISGEEVVKMNLINCKGEVGLVDMFPAPTVVLLKTTLETNDRMV